MTGREGGGAAARVTKPEPTAAYEYVPGTEAEAATLLDVLSLFVPEDQEDGLDDGAEG